VLTLKAELALQLVDNAYLSWTWSALRVGFVLKARPSWVTLKAQAPLVEASQGVYCPGFVQPKKQTNISVTIKLNYCKL